MTYEEAYRESLQSPETFWGKAAEDITWYKKWDKVLDVSNLPFWQWFVGGELNTCYNALDLHVETGRGEQAAVIYDSRSLEPPSSSLTESFFHASKERPVS